MDSYRCELLGREFNGMDRVAAWKLRTRLVAARQLDSPFAFKPQTSKGRTRVA